MKDGRSAVAKYFQLQLPSDNTKHKQSKSKGYVGRAPKSRITSPKITQSPRSQPSHDCVAIDYESTNLLSQHILVGSALRRPHASQFSPLDYQSMPDVGRSPRQPYKSQSSCTVFTYAARPVSARSEPAQFGQHTKSSLLRCKSASAVSSSVSISSSSSCDGNHSKAQCNKKLCKIREDYRFFNTGPIPKQTPPDGESMHAFLTGARYNRTRFLDSKSLSRLGVYISKADLNTFFVKEDKAQHWSDDDDASSSSESSPEGSSSDLEQESKAQHTKTKAVNTEPHFLSISRWQPAEWKTERKNTKEARVTSAPIRIKPVKAYYYDYDNIKRKRPSTSVQIEKTQSASLH